MILQSIGLRSVENFLGGSARSALPGKLKKDLHDLRMVKEADLECCAYYHLRRFLRRDPTWKVFARKHSVHTYHYIDLLIFRRNHPRIAIELHWNKNRISLKDRKSLSASLKRLGVNKAYFMTTVLGAKSYERVLKTEIEKNRLFEIQSPLGLASDGSASFKKERKVFGSKMKKGKARKKVAA